MEVTCENCTTKLNIPDQKIPKGQLVKINCPKCKSKISIDTRAVEETKPPVPEPAPAPQSKEDGYSYDDYSDDEALDFYDEGTKLALIMVRDHDNPGKISASVEELGYKCVPASDTRDATGKMRFHHFDLIVLSEGFDDQPLENGPILNFMNHLSMSIRRRIFLVLLSDEFKTLDNMMAFAMSANAVVNTKELDRLPAILKKAVGDNEKFYKVFMDILVAEGKG